VADTIDSGRRLSRLGLVWLLPLLTAAAAGLAVYQTSPEPPAKFEATVTVRPPTTNLESAAAVNLFVTDLGQQAASDLVRLYILDQIPELDPDTYPSHLVVERQGATSWVALSFVHEDEDVARATVEVLAIRLLDDAARQDSARALFLVEQATGRLSAAEQALDDFAREEGVFDPEVEYRVLLDDISRLNAEIVATSQSEVVDETYLGALTTERNRLVATRKGLGEALLAFERLATEVANAQRALEEARSEHEEAEFEYLGVNSPNNLIGTRDVAPSVDDTPRLQRSVLAGVVALVLALAIVLPLAWLLDKKRVPGRHIDLISESTAGSRESATYRPGETDELLRQLLERR
jgi:hypothetical protein